jgi:hypothetical protein
VALSEKVIMPIIMKFSLPEFNRAENICINGKRLSTEGFVQIWITQLTVGR